MWPELDEMQTKIDKLEPKMSNVSDTAKTELHKKVEHLKKHSMPWASAQVPSEQSDGSLCHHDMRAQTSAQWHFTIDVDWVPGSEVGLEGLLDFCDRWKLKATIFVAGRFAETYADLISDCRRRGHELGTHGWEHGSLEKDEDFRSASYDQQREWIRGRQRPWRSLRVRPSSSVHRACGSAKPPCARSKMRVPLRFICAGAAI